MWTPLDVPASPEQPFTEFWRWRLRDSDDGRHVWDFLKTDVELEAHPPTNTDKYWLGLPLVSLYSSHSSVSFRETFCRTEFTSTLQGKKSPRCSPKRIHILPKNSIKWGPLAWRVRRTYVSLTWPGHRFICFRHVVPHGREARDDSLSLQPRTP